MRALLVMIVLAVATPVMAEEAPPAPAQVEVKPGHSRMIPDTKAVDEDKPVGHPGPSGYWTGYRPAKGGAYKWRLMAVGAGVLALTIVLLVRMLRRAGRSRLTS